MPESIPLGGIGTETCAGSMRARKSRGVRIACFSLLALLEFAPVTAARQPNIVVILSDDHPVSAVSAYGTRKEPKRRSTLPWLCDEDRHRSGPRLVESAR